MNYFKKRARTILKILLLLIILISGWYSLFLLDFSSLRGPTYGVSYASTYAEYLGLEPKTVYLALLDDLKVKNIRISVFWNQTEPQKDTMNFDELDWLMKEAAIRDVNVIFAVGRRVPRGP